MALRELQRALALLYTDSAARERLRDRPEAFRREHRLSTDELASLRALPERGFEAYVASVGRKLARKTG